MSIMRPKVEKPDPSILSKNIKYPGPSVEEENQYKNLGFIKTSEGSFQFDIDEAIEKTREKPERFRMTVQIAKNKPNNLR